MGNRNASAAWLTQDTQTLGLSAPCAAWLATARDRPEYQVHADDPMTCVELKHRATLQTPWTDTGGRCNSRDRKVLHQLVSRIECDAEVVVERLSYDSTIRRLEWTGRADLTPDPRRNPPNPRPPLTQAQEWLRSVVYGHRRVRGVEAAVPETDAERALVDRWTRASLEAGGLQVLQRPWEHAHVTPDGRDVRVLVAVSRFGPRSSVYVVLERDAGRVECRVWKATGRQHDDDDDDPRQWWRAPRTAEALGQAQADVIRAAWAYCAASMGTVYAWARGPRTAPLPLTPTQLAVLDVIRAAVAVVGGVDAGGPVRHTTAVVRPTRGARPYARPP